MTKIGSQTKMALIDRTLGSLSDQEIKDGAYNRNGSYTSKQAYINELNRRDEIKNLRARIATYYPEQIAELEREIAQVRKQGEADARRLKQLEG